MLLKARFTDQSKKNYPHDALLMYAENAVTVLWNQSVLNNLLGAVKVDVKVILTINIDTEDHLTNGQVSEVTQIHIIQNTIRKV